MKSMAVLALLVVALCGCGEPPVKTTVPPVASEPVSENPVVTDTEKKDVGDVEAKVEIELTLESADLPGVTAEELRSQTQKLNMLTISVNAPKPAELWLKIFVKTTEFYTAQPVAFRGKLYREITKGSKEEIFSFNTVLDEFASVHRRQPDGEYFPLEFRADAIKGLADLPETMLLFAEAEVVISPMGTDPKSIDPATYVDVADSVGALLSNAVRINYTSAPATSAPEAATPALESPAPADAAVPVEVPAPAETPAPDAAAPAPAAAPAEAPAPVAESSGANP